MAPTRTLTVAVVDDDAAVRKAVCRLLRSAGFRPRGFANGQEFLEAWLSEPPDCLVLDLQMPGISGVEVQNRLRRAGARPTTICVTAHDREGVREECLLAGAQDYLRKPVEAEELLAAIRRILNSRSLPPD
ncbi:MAG TPA: response regulator [Steroidobacteraceae bacterium]|jgi:FixJ family two-component response regulator